MTAKVLTYNERTNQHYNGTSVIEPDPNKKILVIAKSYSHFYDYLKQRPDHNRPRYAFRFWEVIGRTPEYCEIVLVSWPSDALAASEMEDYILTHGWEW